MTSLTNVHVSRKLKSHFSDFFQMSFEPEHFSSNTKKKKKKRKKSAICLCLLKTTADTPYKNLDILFCPNIKNVNIKCLSKTFFFSLFIIIPAILSVYFCNQSTAVFYFRCFCVYY